MGEGELERRQVKSKYERKWLNKEEEGGQKRAKGEKIGMEKAILDKGRRNLKKNHNLL